MVFGNRSPQSQASSSSSSTTALNRGNHIKPLAILTNAIASVSNAAPMSGSIPFPFHQEHNLATTMKRIKTNDSMLDLSNPQTYRPKLHGIHVDVILQQATCSGWLNKHRAPTFSFIRNIKRRYVVLVDRMLYAFKSETPETYREFLELTKNTHAFVTDQFAGELFCIEIRKVGHDDTCSWFLQADDAESMKLWLDRIKKTIALLRAGTSDSITITQESLAKITTEDEEYARIAQNAKKQAIYSSPTSSQSNISLSDSNSYPQSLNSSFIATSTNPLQPVTHTNNMENESIFSFASSDYSSILDINTSYINSRKSSLRVARPSLTSSLTNYSLPAVLPPQLPPPKSQPPPIPSYAFL
ncbi:hypothetical protein [Parasitella parasitica]|uniref:PH domain-containing protein n=1 Tax=Parasitella parasitica TaxID=35722 RepID=A0A0B7MSE0_9FUNG|nr:hypothetical protein [Parasitella parasitica]